MKRILAVLFSFLFIALPAIPAAAQEVGKNGELNYTYHVDLPPGTNGTGPALNLVYNSMGGNGILGLGWSLDGLPAICRDPLYKINFDHHDHYLFNGQKLVLSNAQHGGDGYYHCEFDDFSRIEAFGNSVDYSHWVMTKKNGLKLYFGYKADEDTELTDGKILSTGQPNRAWIWALSKVEDVLGNYYIIEYEEDPAGGDYYPVRITYTKNNTNRLNKFRTVEFSYERRDDVLTYYSPARITVSHRLKWISVKIDFQLVRKYELTYRTSALTGKSMLCKISEYGSDGNAPWVPYTYKDLSTGTVYYGATGSILCSQDFTWLEAASGFSDLSLAPLSSGWTNYVVHGAGDFNGDGFTDVYLNTRHIFEGGTQHIWYGKAGGGYTDYSMNPLCGANDQAWIFSYIKGAGDYNGDGCTDLYVMSPIPEYQRVLYGKPQGGFRTVEVNVRNLSPELASHWTRGSILSSLQCYMPYAEGDFNGDGKTDLYMNKELGGGGYQHIFSGSPGVSDLISQFNNGLGCKTTITYENAPRVQKAVNSADKSYPYPCQ